MDGDDPALERLVAAWPTLPPERRKAILGQAPDTVAEVHGVLLLLAQELRPYVEGDYPAWEIRAAIERWQGLVRAALGVLEGAAGG